jgi:hypothetical protein
MNISEAVSMDLMIVFGIVILFGRYALVFLDRQVNKFFKNNEQDHGDFITHQHCKLHRDNCQNRRSDTDKIYRKDLKAMKEVMFRIGRKLEIEDDVLVKLIGDGDDV